MTARLGFSLPQQPEIRRPHRDGHQLRQLFKGRNGEGTEMPKAALKCRNRHLSAAFCADFRKNRT
jgi:hypothetical protein